MGDVYWVSWISFSPVQFHWNRGEREVVVTWILGRSAPSASLWMTPSWVDLPLLPRE